MILNQYEMRADIVRHYADHAAEAMDWLIDLGVEFPPEWVVVSGNDGLRRGHPSRGGGGGIAERLINAVGARSIPTALATRVDRLLVEDGRVVGVRSGETTLRAPAVIVTTGGFGNNQAMLERLFPSACNGEPWTWSVTKDVAFNFGDGITMGEAVGANVVGKDCGLLHCSTGFGRYIESFLPPWIALVNQEGRRFMAEFGPYSVTGYLVNEQTDGRAWGIFDNPTLIEAGNDSRYLDPYHSGIPTPVWEEPMIRRQVANGRVKVADTLRGLAEQTHIDPVALAETVRQYNEDCAIGYDTHFFKKAEKLFPIKTPPFYAVEVRSGFIGPTGAGLEIDRDGHVLDRHGIRIPGLYAAGETTGGWHGKRYAGGGASIGGAIVFGRTAGMTAAAEVLANAS